ncbi:restriction endonuclease subunit S [Streptococcus intermedius]|uniref:Putative type I S-subunit protein n=1 Tax=Streptococcus intermedius B196 TaxID=862967 RepID=T1ZED6_STRIT|nr:restriction endonuclease subunit S [Streptococcus intermedius]AGU76056.1 putative type I S-subunit protein [Streptococcus intermedius B196]MDP1433439.1 restriction endonuclease subunit S [Streptococcus intermedius]
MEKEKNKGRIPQLRFPEFKNAPAWEQRKLGEVAEIVGGGTPSTSNPGYWDGDIDWYAPAEIGEKTFVSESKRKISKLGLEKSSAKLLPVGTVLFTSRAGIGNTAILAKSATTNQGFQSIVPKENLLYSYFIYSMTGYLKHYGEVTGAGSTFVEVSGKQMAKCPISLPSLPEQKAIGDFFSTLDRSIALHQRELENLKNRKKSLLQKMFPKNGESVPKIRFPEFKNAPAWEQRKLGEVAEITMGQSPNSANYTNNPSDHILVQGNADMRNGYVHPRVWTTQVTKTAKKGALIISVRAPVGDVGKTEYNVVLGRGVAAIQGNEFIFQLLSKMKINGYWEKLSTGSTFESINSNDLKDASISLPSLPEQTAIGDFFSTLDRSIALHQRKLEHLKLRKKALLQKIFP